MNVISNLNLNNNEIQNALMHPLAATPSNPKEGQIYYNSNLKGLYIYNGSDWIRCDQTGTAGDWSSLKNKPEGIVIDEAYNHTDNNYTTVEKDKLANIEAGAEKNIPSDWNSNSGASEIKNKPTKLSQFTNDTNFVTQEDVYTKTQTMSKEEIGKLVGDSVKGRFKVVDELPSHGEPNIMYLVPSKKPGDKNIKSEYIWIESLSSFEKIGDTDIDLSNYVTKNTLEEATNKITALEQKNNELAQVAKDGNYNSLNGLPQLVKVEEYEQSTTEKTYEVQGKIFSVTLIDKEDNREVLADITHGTLSEYNDKKVTVNLGNYSGTIKVLIAYLTSPEA